MRGYTCLIISTVSIILAEAQIDSFRNQNCFCLPPNQVCDPTQVVPRSAVRIEVVVDTRILNKNPESLCDANRHACCFGGIGDTREPGLPGGTGHPTQLSECGSRRSIYARNNAGEADFGEYPWMALVVDSRNSFITTAALINPSHVITAAHRIPQNARNLQIRFGDYDISNEFDNQEYPLKTIPVAEVIIHPNFDSKSLKNDIAVIRLAHPIRFTSHIQPVCLPEKGQKFLGQRCYVSGWGKKGVDGQFQAVMKEVDVPIVDAIDCQGLLRRTELSSHFNLDKSFICAGGETGKDACEGDGGAPMVCNENGKAVVVGLVAWGQSCGTHVPGVYVNIAYLIDFILNNSKA